MPVISPVCLSSLALSLEQSAKEDKRIIVLHNLRERTTVEEMNEVRTRNLHPDLARLHFDQRSRCSIKA